MTPEEQLIDDRDHAEAMLDKFAYAIAPVEVIGEHSSANDPWANALEMLTSAAEVRQLTADRDRAREIAVALEQENARLTAKLNAIAKLHSHVPLCVECREIQPCDTRAILDGGEAL